MGVSQLSIIIPFYNAAPALEEALRSAAAQTGIERYIAAIDDGSTDCSLRTALEFEPPIHVVTGRTRAVRPDGNQGSRGPRGGGLESLEAVVRLVPGRLLAGLGTREGVAPNSACWVGMSFSHTATAWSNVGLKRAASLSL